MRDVLKNRLLTAAVLWVGLATPHNHAAAYEFMYDQDGAMQLLWYESEVVFHLGDAPPEEVDASRLPEVIASMADRWTGTSCAVVPELSYGGIVAANDHTHPTETVPDNAVVFIRSKQAWRDLERLHRDAGDPRQVGITVPVFDIETGQLIDADILLNDAYHVFTLDEPQGPGEVSLQAVLLHELGHLFGLAHSTVPGAVMARHYDVTSTTLTMDDEDGVCAIYLERPQITEIDRPNPQDPSGCQGAPTPMALPILLGLLGLAGTRRRRGSSARGS